MATKVHNWQVIIRSDQLCTNTQEIIASDLFRELLTRYVARLDRYDSPLLAALEVFRVEESAQEQNKGSKYDIDRLALFLSLLSEQGLSLIAGQVGIQEINSVNRQQYREFVEGLYDFWREHQRFLVADDNDGDTKSLSQKHNEFIDTIDRLKRLVLQSYRGIVANLQGSIPRVYRQLPAGSGAGLLLQQLDWNTLPYPYDQLAGIPFIQTAVIEPPLVYYPKRNVRQGVFKPVDSNPLCRTRINREDWYCFPVKVGPLLIFMHFHKRYMSLAVSMANLFELADRLEIVGHRPDAILVFGVDPEDLGEDQTVYYEDHENNVVLGVVGRTDEVDYFGYVKKMILTLHNTIMIERGMLPVHGAMAHIDLKEGGVANVILMGDSGAGKSESIEAFRILADEYLRELIVVFDDMGSLHIGPDGNVYGIGTEIGAFLRLDDLEPGFAYKEFQRSIFMNPHKTNARVVIPVTPYEDVIRPWKVDMFLYANNYQMVANEGACIRVFDDPEDALQVFSRGARLSKGTTDEQGLVYTYFSNPFGAIQKREKHEEIAGKFINRMMETNVIVGELLTQLGLSGMEQKGPEAAAKALLSFIQKTCESK